MSYSNQKTKIPKVITFPQSLASATTVDASQAAGAVEQARNSDFTNFPLPVHGQGVFIFKLQDSLVWNAENMISLSYRNSPQDNRDGLLLQISGGRLRLSRIKTGELLARGECGWVDAKDAFYWVSLDAQNYLISFGVGEARQENVGFSYTFPLVRDENKKDLTKPFLESLICLTYQAENVSPLRYLRDPIVNKPTPMLVKNVDELTMVAIAENRYLPKANLSPIGQRLYGNIAGKNFVLDDADFPEFSAAIQYSINNEAGWCYKKLREKASEFGPSNLLATYLRITLGQNNGESPGIPYVMEIWPPQHFSPVHNHSSANAIIRVLHGAITVSLFPYLDPKMPPAFATVTFYRDEITWISPTLNQTHQLKNNGGDTPCITIQCYMYDEEDSNHYDYFDYLGEKDIEQYEPDSDMDYLDFRKQMIYEWNVLRKER
ncbi:MAG: hypothetical protein RI894_1818 [Bacteroidota bacterium]|jgi:hypothetical protein